MVGNPSPEQALDGGALGLDTSAGDYVYNSPLPANGPITKFGAHTLVLTGPVGGENYPFTIAGGTVQAGNANSFFAIPVTVNAATSLTFSAGVGTFNVGGLNGAGNISLTDTGGTAISLVIRGYSGTMNYSGNLSGAGSLTLSNNNTTQTLSGSNSYSGATTIINGNLAYTTLTAVSPNSIITINSPGAVNVGGAYSSVAGWLGSGMINPASTGAIAVSGVDTETVNLSTAYNGNTYSTLSLGAAAGGATFSGNLTPAGSTLYLGGGGPLTYTPALSGANGLAIEGTVTLAAIPGPGFTGPTTISNGGVLKLPASGSGTFASNISGGGELFWQGSGLLALTGNLSYTWVSIFGNQSLPFSSGGTVQLTGVNTFANTVAGNTTLIISGGTTTLNGTNNFYNDPQDLGGGHSTAHPTIINSGGVLSFSSASNFPPTFTYLIYQDNDTLQITGGTLLYTGAGSAATLLRTGVNNGAINVANAGGNLTFGWAVDNGSFTKTGLGVLTLGGQQQNTSLGVNVQQGTLVLAKTDGSYAAASVSGVSPGATLQIGYSGTQISGGVSNMNGTFDFNGMSETFAAGTLSGAGTVTNSAGSPTSTLTFGGGSGAFAGAIANGAGTMALTVNGGADFDPDRDGQRLQRRDRDQQRPTQHRRRDQPRLAARQRRHQQRHDRRVDLRHARRHERHCQRQH